ncbi:MAG: nickel pincer cofactor biosynthesis protein LarC, partial [Deltaproteobacteria bacterium]|nr:nickel pincer cofactor biosynthesis protein LarC [Deltaproteobacteria bacterium]
MKIAYLDCFSGVSGDMFLGALLDAGLSIDELEEGLQRLPLEGYRLEVKREKRCGISGTRMRVICDGDKQVHRNLGVIRDIIRQGDLGREVEEKSIRVFEDLARVEGKIHDLPAEEIHFHEVGAVDSIVDIVGVMYGMERLGVRSLCVSELPLGSGFVETAHGRIPVPAPASIALLKGLPVYDSGIPHEMVTPTGAALVKNLARSFGPMPTMRPEKIGYGAGKRDLPDRPNLLRIIIGEQAPEQEAD